MEGFLLRTRHDVRRVLNISETIWAPTRELNIKLPISLAMMVKESWFAALFESSAATLAQAFG
ncbi:MAG: hypothetical protein V4601_14335 [Pseudomonadota bacterium]